jgi:TolB-like protein/DNA-binding winged helix-turn-helix (wHTH) protein/tetratricopeptide (TPR) repeat protein
VTPAPSPRRYAFAGYRVDLQTRVLLDSDGAPVVLTAKAFDVLGHLLEHRDRVVDKAELLDVVWRGRVVEENSLTQAVSMLRRALGAEAGDHRYILTVSGRGYRFVADVETDPDEGPPARAGSGGSLSTPARATHRWSVLLGALLAFGLVAVIAWSTREPPPAPAMGQATLAVLPFRSLSAESPDPMLELGLAETVIARLSRAGSVRVLSLASAERVAGRTWDPLAAARELGAAYVVEGSTQRRGDRVRVNVRLLAAPGGNTIWADTFDEHVDRVFTLQDGIAGAVLSALAVSPLAKVAASLCEGADARAFRTYLNGRYLMQRPTPERIAKAIAAFQRTIELDPACAPAYVGMAQTYRAMVITGDRAPADVYPLAKAAADQALRIDPASAGAWAAKAFNQSWYDWDWGGAEASAKRAIEWNPSLPEAQFAYAHLLVNRGRFEEGLAHMRKARELDPLSPLLNTLEAGFLGAAGRPEAARVQLQRALELEPDFWIALLIRGGMALDRGDTAAAVADLQRSVETSHGNTQAMAVLAIANVAAGDRARAEAILQDLERRAAKQYVPASSIASVHNALGREDAALDDLERALLAHDIRMAFLKIDARWNNLRDEPRFQTMASKVGLSGGQAHGRF